VDIASTSLPRSPGCVEVQHCWRRSRYLPRSSWPVQDGCFGRHEFCQSTRLMHKLGRRPHGCRPSSEDSAPQGAGPSPMPALVTGNESPRIREASRTGTPVPARVGSSPFPKENSHARHPDIQRSAPNPGAAGWIRPRRNPTRTAVQAARAVASPALLRQVQGTPVDRLPRRRLILRGPPSPTAQPAPQ
jgi:hypothetical protein